MSGDAPALDEGLLRYGEWEGRAAELAARWRGARPFSHAVIDGFLDARGCAALREEFRDLGAEGWIENRHASQRLRSRNGFDRLGAEARAVVEALEAPRFRAWLSEVTGVPGLFLDREMTDGGLSAMGRGDFFDLHTDMQAHAFNRRWRRRVNLIVYLSETWDDAWGGALEFWDPSGRERIAAVSARESRAVLFEVSPRAVHGVPEPLRCPEGALRQNLVLYYFTEEDASVPITHFRYRARPGELLRRPLVFANNAALALYQLARQRVGDVDAHVSRVIRRR